MRPFLRSPSICPDVKLTDNGLDNKSMSHEPGESYLLITVMSARNLPLPIGKRDNLYNNVAIMSSLQYIYCSLWLSPIESLTLDTTKQPKTENPTFRDEFSFKLRFGTMLDDKFIREPKTDNELLARLLEVTVNCCVYLRTPLTLSQSKLMLGAFRLRLNALTFTSIPSEPVTAWYPLYDSTDIILPNNAAVKLKVQVMN